MHITSSGPRKSDKYIPWYFVGFFALLFIWDGYFTYLATSTFTGVVEDHTYNRGKNYNQTIAASDAQAALGWKSILTLQSDDAQLIFKLRDADGNAISGAKVVAFFFRPTQAGGDTLKPLTETNSGTYQINTVGTAPGQWDVRIFVQWKQLRYQMSKRIVVPNR